MRASRSRCCNSPRRFRYQEFGDHPECNLLSGPEQLRESSLNAEAFRLELVDQDSRDLEELGGLHGDDGQGPPITTDGRSFA